jgi:hypothetical protein
VEDGKQVVWPNTKADAPGGPRKTELTDELPKGATANGFEASGGTLANTLPPDDAGKAVDEKGATANGFEASRGKLANTLPPDEADGTANAFELHTNKLLETANERGCKR